MAYETPIIFIDENGKAYGVKQVGNQPFVVAVPFMQEVARGLVSGFSSINKFGRNIEIDNGVTADIWDGGHTADESLIWVAPTQARVHNIASTSASDAAAGVGARTIRVFGLPDWDSAETSQDIIMDGTSDVPTTALVIINRMEVLTKGTTSVNVGTITATAVTDGTVSAKIRPGQGQTQMAIFGIPSTQTAYMGRLYTNANKAGGAAALADVSLLYNPEPNTELLNFLTKHSLGLLTDGTSALTIPFFAPKVFVGPGILKIQVLSGTNNMDISAGFDLLIVDN